MCVRDSEEIMRRSSLLWCLVAIAVPTARALELGVVRDSALPLAGKRILLTMPRVEAAPLASKLLSAGARPMWCPGVRMEPLADTSELDDALMRLTEYDVVAVLCQHSIDAVAQRWLALADGSTDLISTMIEASSVEIGAIGTDALHFRQAIGSPASVVPIEHSARALAATLQDLGHLHPGARVLLPAASIGERGSSSSDDADAAAAVPAAVDAFIDEAERHGAMVERVASHFLVPASRADVAPELSLVTSGHIDAVCAASAEELRSLFGSGGAEGAATAAAAELSAASLVLALGTETAAVARGLVSDSGGSTGGAGSDEAAAAAATTLIELGSRDGADAIVAALEEHFGAGRLLF